MGRLRREEGFTLPELLVGTMLMLIVMSASLMVLERFTSLSGRTERRIDLQDQARTTARHIARSLRNPAGSTELPTVVERSGAYDIVFRAVDRPRADSGDNVRNLRRIRLCLDSSNPDRARLLEQTQRWNTALAPAVPTSSACPSADWGGSRVVADRLTNRANGQNRALWAYGRTDANEIQSVKLNLFMNDVPSTRSREISLRTGVFLRNQNRAPTAAFTATPAGVRHILLNGSSSYDPEGQPLEFRWYVNGDEVAEGVSYDYSAPAAGTYSITLEVRDSGGLMHSAGPQEVVVQ